VDSSELSVQPRAKPFADAAFIPVGNGFTMKPGGRIFAKPVTVQLPINPNMSGDQGRPEDVRIFTRGEGETEFTMLPTRLDPSRRFVEAAVMHFSDFQAGFMSGGGSTCYAPNGLDSDSDSCADDVCSLPAFISGSSITTAHVKAKLVKKATGACNAANKGKTQLAIDRVRVVRAQVAEYRDVGKIERPVAKSILAFSKNSLTILQNNTGPTVSGDGLWSGYIDVGPRHRPFAFQFKATADGGVLGYVLGGGSFRTVSGSISGSTLSVTVEMNYRTYQLVGTISGNTWSGLATQTGGPQTDPVRPFTFTRRTDVLTERRFIFVQSGGSEEEEGMSEMAVAFDSTGALVTGNWKPWKANVGCLLSCGDGVTSFVEDTVSNTLTVGLETGGTCPGTGSFTVVFDPVTKFYSGSGSFATEPGCVGGTPVTFTDVPIMGVRLSRGRSDDAASVLTALSKIVNDLEGHLTGSSAGAAISSTFLHNGLTRSAYLASLTDEETQYSDISATFSAIRNIMTVSDPYAYAMPGLPSTPSLQFHDARAGKLSGASTFTQYRDDDNDAACKDELRFVAQESGAWVFSGNVDMNECGFGLPYHVADKRHNMYGYWPWGVHGTPGGHEEGHPGIDIELAPPVFDGMGNILSETNVIAMHTGTGGGIYSYPEDPFTHTAVNAGIDTDFYRTYYASMHSWAIAEGAPVTEGDTVGHPAYFAVGGTSTTVGMFHFGVVPPDGSDPGVCPYIALRSSAQTLMRQEFHDNGFYSAQVIEPFLCNDPDRNGDQFPMTTTWTRTTSVSSQNPAKVRFTRCAVEDMHYAWEWIDGSGTVIASGTTDPIPSVLDLNMNFHGTAPSYGLYRVRGGIDATSNDTDMLLDVGGSTVGSRPANLTLADTYTPEVTDNAVLTPGLCPP
jgi:hypothetical protein